MFVRFWGVRGSIPTPGVETLRHGGNTPCVEVRTNGGTVMILDCGTGARKLGLSLIQSGPVRAHLFIGHTHSDHIQGLPFFVPAFVPGSHLTIYGPAGIDRSLPTAIGGQMDYSYFPIPFQDLLAKLDFEELGEGEFSLEDVRVRTQYLNHTSPCLGYRIEVGGVTLVYVTDHEPHAATLWRPDRPEGLFDARAMLHQGDVRHCHFLRDADLVIHDSQFTAAEYSKRLGWGHSPFEYSVDVALAARVRKLALFHHDPTRGDDALEALVAIAHARATAAGSSMEVVAPEEGTELALAEGAAPAESLGGPSAPRAPISARILVADDDDSIAALLQAGLRRDGYQVVRAANGAEAVQLARRHTFDLILMDKEMPEMDGFTACRELRADKRLESLPVVMLTSLSGPEHVMAGFAAGVTDYMTKPFSLAQVRARVRSWLTRTTGGQ